MRSTFDQTFNINTITIHTVEGASCVNIGNNFPAGFESYKKHTQGFGSISGNDNTIEGIRSLLHDHSLADTFSGSDLYNSPWIKELMESKMQEVLDAEDLDWLNDNDGEDSEAMEDGETDTDSNDDDLDDLDDVCDVYDLYEEDED